jgi:hypothetical protein
MFLFNLIVVFITNFLKMAPIRVHFSPGFPPGAGFHGEELALSCFERHARAAKNGAYSTEAALACSTERNAPAYFYPHAERTISRGGNRFYV